MEKEPEIRYEEGYAVTKEIEVRLECGICGRPAAAITKECNKYDNDIIINASQCEEEKCLIQDYKRNMIELLGLGAERGKKLDVMVENIPGTHPERILKRLYSGLTSEDFYPDFDRFGENLKK